MQTARGELLIRMPGILLLKLFLESSGKNPEAAVPITSVRLIPELNSQAKRHIAV